MRAGRGKGRRKVPRSPRCSVTSTCDASCWAGNCWGYARRFGAEIVNYADDFVVCGKAPAAAMLAAVERITETLRLPLNATKTRCLRTPEEPFEFLGYRIGRNYSPRTGRAYIGTRPSAASVRSLCRKISELTAARYGTAGAGASGGEAEPSHARLGATTSSLAR